MAVNPKSAPIKATTQEHLDIYDVVDDLLVMKNGNVSLVLETSAVNFDLLSEAEQDARVEAFAGLINSLTFHIQVLIRTQNVDITAYLQYLERQRKLQMAPHIRQQITIYQQFVKNLIKDRNVLDKRFFVVIPFSTGSVQKTSLMKQMFGKPMKITNVEWVLDKAKSSLYPKRDHVMKQLKRMGVNSRQITTEELIRLFYNIYNPGTSPLQKIQLKAEEFEVPIISGK